ncbi:uncharacterized protein MAM_03772 [Metarhizium album ARSEF 1941]|uniref:Uncharacterized protein n=1 Tax=Metarhizium album (strain ARSEF 1941) TaxID=1081103 RepID=A0A0B2WX72_METAS|nr:uncharacterized protein MAM_03772 [Metarhizium album ARSEF 1941]KHN98648.1 hypothetical protein MAM_03772 [Metarhizium album ARSEF 1941]
MDRDCRVDWSTWHNPIRGFSADSPSGSQSGGRARQHGVSHSEITLPADDKAAPGGGSFWGHLKKKRYHSDV